MMYAWPTGEVDRTNLDNRIQADLHQNEEGVCPLHGCIVVSTQVNYIWQWVHKTTCSSRRVGRKGTKC